MAAKTTNKTKSGKKTAEISLTELTPVELLEKAKSLRGEIAKIVMERQNKKDRNTRKAYALRKQLARTLTVLNEKNTVK